MTHCTASRNGAAAPIVGSRGGVERTEHRRTGEPRAGERARRDVVAGQAAGGDGGEGRADRRGEGRIVRDDRIEPRFVPADEIHLVDREDDLPDAEEVDEEAVPPRLLEHPWVASTRMIARSAVDAPVTMLRVYWTWPGVSATMNLRVALAKKR